MKITKLLIALLLFVPLFQACQDDISELDDPRDAIAKAWRVSESGDNYDCTITKDANESTRVNFSNFHNLGTVTTDRVYGVLVGTTVNIPSQVIDGEYTISGSGIVSSDFEEIDFTYTVQEGADPAVDFTANFGPVNVTKKKISKPVQ